MRLKLKKILLACLVCVRDASRDVQLDYNGAGTLLFIYLLWFWLKLRLWTNSGYVCIGAWLNLFRRVTVCWSIKHHDCAMSKHTAINCDETRLERIAYVTERTLLMLEFECVVVWCLMHVEKIAIAHACVFQIHTLLWRQHTAPVWFWFWWNICNDIVLDLDEQRVRLYYSVFFNLNILLLGVGIPTMHYYTITMIAHSCAIQANTLVLVWCMF